MKVPKKSCTVWVQTVEKPADWRRAVYIKLPSLQGFYSMGEELKVKAWRIRK